MKRYVATALPDVVTMCLQMDMFSKHIRIRLQRSPAKTYPAAIWTWKLALIRRADAACSTAQWVICIGMMRKIFFAMTGTAPRLTSTSVVERKADAAHTNAHQGLSADPMRATSTARTGYARMSTVTPAALKLQSAVHSTWPGALVELS
jgi:hypothetical protein